MKSSNDIPPLVGMQVNFIGAVIAITSLGRDWFEGIVISNTPEAAYQPGDRWVGGNAIWNSGNYSIAWTPPTDDERRLFVEAARHCANVWKTGSFRPEDCSGMCAWGSGFYSCEQAAIAESLALDGADYDNMPDLEELER